MRNVKFWTVSLLLSGAFFLAACNSNDDKDWKPGMVSPVIQEQFQQRFPNARNVQWKNVNGYSIASFQDAVTGETCTAWFAQIDSYWDMTEYEVPYASIPDSVKAAFLNTKYARNPWQLDQEVSVLERAENETLYIISVEKNDTQKVEMDLYFTKDGFLVKEVVDEDKAHGFEDYLPEKPTTDIHAYIDEHFPGGRVIDIETENGGTEIELIYRNKKYEVLFDARQQWLYTKCDMPFSEIVNLPPKVLDALKRESSTGDLPVIEEYEFYQTKNQGDFYCFEIVDRFDDRDVYINLNGTVIGRPSFDFGGSGGVGIPVDKNISSVIDSLYFGAVIVNKDYDDGLLEVDFKHESKIKTASFNGRGQWVRTEWDVLYTELPSAVILTLREKYSKFNIEADDIECIEAPDQIGSLNPGRWYEIEMQSGHLEKKVGIFEDGRVKFERYDD